MTDNERNQDRQEQDALLDEWYRTGERPYVTSC